METVLKLVDVEKYYSVGCLSFKALDHVSFFLERGELTSIVGAYGSGRTVLLNVMGCLCRPSSGRVIVCGTDTAKATPEQVDRLRNREIGFISGAHNLIGDMTVLENLELAIRPTRWKGSEERLRTMLDAVGLSKKAQVLASRLSSEEARYLALAKGIVGTPGILICDDPTCGLGERHSVGVVQLLAKFGAEGDTTVIVGSPRDLLKGVEHSVIEVSNGKATLAEG